MNVKFDEDEILTDFVLNFADCNLSIAEQKSFTELMANDRVLRRQAFTNWYIRSALSFLKPVSTSETFDQKMAARFSLELEKEVEDQNKINAEKTETT